MSPYCVVLENSDHESEDHARQQFERLLEAALEQGCVLDAVVAENLAQARALWHIRESIPLAQAQEGLNIKHDISIAVSRIPAFVQEADAHCRRLSRACAWSTTATWAMAICTTTCRPHLTPMQKCF